MSLLPDFFLRWAKASHKRSVNAASVNWPDDKASASASADVLQASQLTGQRVAGLYLNDPVVRSGIDLLVSNMVGSGSRVNYSNADSEVEFNTAKLDPSRLQSSTAIQRAAIYSWAINGEFLGIHRLLDDGYAIQILHSEQLDRSKNQELTGTARIIAGVEYDGFDRIVAYWILPHAPGDHFASITQSIRFAAGDVVHVFERHFIGQVRGISPLVAALPVANTASIAQDAMAKRLQISAMFLGAITSPDGSDSFEGNPNPSMEPGAILRFRPGEDFETFQAADAGDYMAFFKMLYRSIAASIGVTYEDLTGDLSGVNYSSYRGGSLTARRKAEARRKVLLIEGLLDPVFEHWQAIKMLDGESKADQAHSWIEPAWPQIDPQKEAKAEIELLNAKLKSRKEIIEARGRDFEAVNTEINNDDLSTIKEVEAA